MWWGVFWCVVVGAGDGRGGERGSGIVAWLCPPLGALRTSLEGERGEGGGGCNEKETNEQSRRVNRLTTNRPIPAPFYSGYFTRKFAHLPFTHQPRSQFRLGYSSYISGRKKSILGVKSQKVCHRLMAHRHRPGTEQKHQIILSLFNYPSAAKERAKEHRTNNVQRDASTTTYRQSCTTTLHPPPRQSQRRLPLVRLKSRCRPGLAYHPVSLDDSPIRAPLCSEAITEVYKVCPDRWMFGRVGRRVVGHVGEWFSVLCGAWDRCRDGYRGYHCHPQGMFHFVLEMVHN